jgi:hypothetical protein
MPGIDLGDVGTSLSRAICPLRGKKESIDDDDEKRRAPDRTCTMMVMRVGLVSDLAALAGLLI